MGRIHRTLKVAPADGGWRKVAKDRIGEGFHVRVLPRWWRKAANQGGRALFPKKNPRESEEKQEDGKDPRQAVDDA